MALLLVLGPLLLPEYRDPAAGRLDPKSAGLSLLAVLAVIYGMKEAAQDGIGGLSLATIAAGVLLGTAFVRRQQRLADPLIDLRLFRVPAFRLSLATFLLTTAVTFGVYIYVGQYLQLVVGLTPRAAGLWLLPGAIGVTIGSLLAPAIVRRIHPAYVMGVGLALAAIGFVIFAQAGRLGLASVVVGSVVLYFGLGPVFTLGTDLIVSAAPPERAGAAAAISETSSELGGALGIAVFGSIGAAAYRSAVASTRLDGVPPAALRAARDTLGGATAAAAQLPGEAGARLADTARDAFTHAFALTSSICAAIAAAAAVAALVLLRRVTRHPAAVAPS
jgi:DHA2 family multidrug resistance protein-like MFS transporter